MQATASRNSPQAATAAKSVSPLAGPDGQRREGDPGAALRASSREPRTSSVISTAATPVAPSVTTVTLTQNGSVMPIRSRPTNDSSAPGGWPATWIIQLSGCAYGMRSM